MLHPRVKYPKGFGTDEEIDMAVRMRQFIDNDLIPEPQNFEGGWRRDGKLVNLVKKMIKT
jgi:hypothetical protein